jgi:hypothetical protein
MFTYNRFPYYCYGQNFARNNSQFSQLVKDPNLNFRNDLMNSLVDFSLNGSSSNSPPSNYSLNNSYTNRSSKNVSSSYSFLGDIINYFNQNIQNNSTYEYLRDYQVYGTLQLDKDNISYKNNVNVVFGTRIDYVPNVRLSQVTSGNDNFNNSYVLYQEYKQEKKSSGKIDRIFKASWFLTIRNKDQGITLWYKINNV